MSMTLDEAARIALDRCTKHATVTYDLAAQVLLRAGEPALRQLAEMKAVARRSCGKDIGEVIGELQDIGN